MAASVEDKLRIEAFVVGEQKNLIETVLWEVSGGRVDRVKRDESEKRMRGV